MDNRDLAKPLHWSKTLGLHLCIVGVLACGCAGEEPQQSQASFAPVGEDKAGQRHLQDLVANAFTLQTLEALLVTSRLASEMDSPPYTMFMPWDNAFRRMPAFWERAKSDPRWRAHLRSIADAHMYKGLAPVPQGEDVTLAMMDGSSATFTEQNSRRRLDGILVIAETAAVDGHAYMIDEVRLPPWVERTAWDVVDTDPRFSIFKSLLTAEDRALLEQTDNTTLFAPTDAAFGGDAEWARDSGLDIGDFIVDQVMPRRWTQPGEYSARSGASLAWQAGTGDAPRTVTCTVAGGETHAAVTLETREELANNGVVHPVDRLLCVSTHECDVECAPGEVLAEGCAASSITLDEAMCEAEHTRCCTLPFECTIACDAGSALSESCDLSTATNEQQCAAMREECCLPDSTPVNCEIVCGEGSARSEQCQASIVTDDVAACNAERQACCEPTGAPIVLQPPRPQADTPCYDYCGQGSRMLGSKVVPAALLPGDWEHDATCWEYAISNEADATACTQPDEHIRAHCCYPDDDPVTSAGVGNYCCLCDGCYGVDSSRFEHVITSSRQSCVALDWDMTSDLKLGSNEPDAEENRRACLGMRSAFEATCCSADMGTDANGADVPVPPSLAPEVYQPEPYFCDSRGPHPFCSLCRNGSFPTQPYNVATVAGIPGNPTCSDLYMMGITNNLPAAYCYPLQNFLEEPCGCEPEAPPGPLCPAP